jgi:hypothetical protein
VWGRSRHQKGGINSSDGRTVRLDKVVILGDEHFGKSLGIRNQEPFLVEWAKIADNTVVWNGIYPVEVISKCLDMGDIGEPTYHSIMGTPVGRALMVLS